MGCYKKPSFCSKFYYNFMGFHAQNREIRYYTLNYEIQFEYSYRDMSKTAGAYPDLSADEQNRVFLYH